MPLNLRERLTVAGVQYGFLVGEIVVQRGLLHPQLFGDLIQGRGVVPSLTESTKRGP